MTGLGQELRQPSQVWASLVAEATRNLFVGRMEDAEEIVRRVAELGSHAQGLDATYYYVTNLQGWALRREQGRLGEVEASLESYVEEYPESSSSAVCSRASTASWDATGARDELDRLAADDFADLHVGTEWFFGASLRQESAPSSGTPRAPRPLRGTLAYANYNVFAHPDVALGSASRPLGLLATTMSRWDEAGRHFERALEMNARMGARPWVAHTQRDYARMLIRRGAPDDERRASELLRAARSAYEELGMRPWQLSTANDLTSVQ